MAATKSFTIKDTLRGNILLTFDALITEKHKRSSEITTNPIESNLEITDFVIKAPLTAEIEGFITDTPTVNQTLGNRRKQVFDIINRIYDERIIIDVVTNLQIYKRMVMVNADISLNDATGQGMPVSLSLQQVVLAVARAASIGRKVREQPQGAQNESKADRSQQNGEDEAKPRVYEAFLQNAGL